MTRKVRILLASLLAVALVATAVWVGYGRRAALLPPEPLAFGEQAPAEVTLTALAVDSTGVDTTSGFLLKSVKSLSTDAVRKGLSLTPAVLFKVEKADLLGKEFRILPERSLDPNRVYRLRLTSINDLGRSYQWSFQTKAVFRVLGSLPRNQATGVPLNTGIEIAFSHENYNDIDQYFQIEPAVPGRFERHKKTVAFVPKEPLAAGTVYTVTLKPGLTQAEGGGKLSEPYRFAFETQAQESGGNPAWFYVPSTSQEFPAGETPYFQVNLSKTTAQSVAVKTWRYPDAAAYAAALDRVQQIPWWANYNRSRYVEETAGLNQAAGFDTAVRQAGDNATYVLFPEALPPGYYLAELTIPGATRQIHFQVTDLASYLTVSATKSLVWLHDLSTSEPAAGAEVRFVQVSPGASAGKPAGTSATTDKDGVASLPTPAEMAHVDYRGGAYLLAQLPASGGAAPKEALLVSDAAYRYWGGYGSDPEQVARYWRYLYTDRSLYKPDDTVYLWGIVRPRAVGAKPLERVTARITSWGFPGPDGRPAALVEQEIALKESVFTGALTLPGLRPGYYSLELVAGDLVLSTAGIEVQTYSKPAYRIEVTPSVKALFAGDAMEFKAKASFFEGTPVAGIKLSPNINWNGKDGLPLVETDDAGEATIPFTPSGGGDGGLYGQAFQTLWLNLRASLPEVGELTAQTTATLFPRTVSLEASSRAEQGTAQVTARVNRITLDKLNAGSPIWPAENYLGEPMAGLTVSGTITEQNWIKIEDGEYYDFISKQVVKRYRYQEAPKHIGDFEAVTDSEGRISHSFPIDKEKAYKVLLRTRDTRGELVAREIYVWGNWYSNGKDYKYYYVAPTGNQKSTWRLNEEVALTIKESDRPLDDKKGGFLFMTSRMGLQGYKVQDSAIFRTALREADLPNIYVSGVYFDGRFYRIAGERIVPLDPAERKLSVTVTPDRPSYRPGETATLRVQVNDRQGRPVSAQVNLNLVDEALYALRDQSVNLLETLYHEHLPSGIYRSQASHEVPRPDGMAEKGGDGGGVRADFRDAAFFETITTDAKGQATVKVKLPDNLTAWRLTYQAILPTTMEAASGTLPVVVKLPFFIDMVLGETYLAGDKPVLIVRSYGAELTRTQTVTYQVTLVDPDGKKQEWTKKGAAFAPLQFPLPKLETGRYTLTVSGASDSGLQDAIQRPIDVQETYLSQTKVDFSLLDPTTRVKGADKGLTTLTFTDYERGRYQRLLERLSWEWGNRLEQKLARTVAADLLKEHFAAERVPGDDGVDLMAYQTPDGGLAILPYADADLKLSALATDLAADRFDRAGLLTYFQKVLDDPGAGREQASLALYGLAALDEPVLMTVRKLLTEKDLTLEEQLTLALAAAKLGDLEAARPVYYAILKEYGEQIGDVARIKTGSTQDEMLAATALTAALGGKLGETQTVAFAGYLLENGTREVLLLTEELLAAQAALPALSGKEISFTYLLRGKETKKVLKPGEVMRLYLTPEALKTLQIKEVKGQVGLTAAYAAPLRSSDLRTEADFKLSLSRSVEGRSLNPGDRYKVGDLIRFSATAAIPADAPAGTYELSVFLPSGLRLVQKPWQYGVKGEKWLGWPLEVNGQKVTFWASRDGSPTVFYARVASPGEYTMEQSILVFQKSGKIYATGKRERVRIE